MQKLDPALRGGPTIQYQVHLEAPQKISRTRNSVSFFFFSFLLLGFFTWKIKHGFGGVVYIIIAMLWQEIKRVERKLDVEMFIDRVVGLHYGSSLGCAIERKERASPTEVPVY